MQKLIADHEPDYAQQWHQQEPGYVQQMLSGIVGFELQVSDLQCKLKLNQHRPEAFSAIWSMYVKGSDGEQELARWMERIGMKDKPDIPGGR